MGAAAYQRGLVLAEMGQPAEALEDFIRSLDLGSDPARGYYQMALIYTGQREWSLARKFVEQSLQQDATYAPALALQGRLKTQGGPRH